jgi:copper(I)-binding protein
LTGAAQRGALLAFALCLLAPVTAGAVEIEPGTAWMRPAAAGSEANAYVDIVSDTPLTLVGAATPLAARVDVMVVQQTDGLDPGKRVESLPVAQGMTRLAYKGNHLRLVGVREPVANGRTVPVTLRFRDGAGKRHEAVAQVQVRGLLLPGG